MPAAASDRPFVDPSRPPTDERLAAELSAAWPGFRRLLELSVGYAKDWQFAGKGGWMLKIHARGKALFYLIPLSGAFRLSAAIRENERDAMASDPTLAMLHDKLSGAKKFAEGYAVVIDVAGAELQPADTFAEKLIELRR